MGDHLFPARRLRVSQSIAAVPVPYSTKQAKSSRVSQVPWAMIRPAAALEGVEACGSGPERGWQ
jgi:hypothetical protein